MWTNPLAGAGSSAAAESAAAGPSAAGPEDSSSDGSGSPHRPTRSRRGIRMVYPGQSRSERGPGAGAEGGKAAAGDDTLLDVRCPSVPPHPARSLAHCYTLPPIYGHVCGARRARLTWMPSTSAL